MQKDTRGTLKYIRDLGFTAIELPGGYYKLTMKEFKAECDQLGLKSTSMLAGFEMYRDSIEKVIAQAKFFGIKAVGCGWIPHNGNNFTREDAVEAINIFNKAGERLAKEGITVFYHCHGYEFRPSPEVTLFDLMVQKTNPENVKFELDVYWAFHGGAIPELLLKKYPTRFIALHIKDMKIGQATGEYSGATTLTSDVAVGTGQLNF